MVRVVKLGAQSVGEIAAGRRRRRDHRGLPGDEIVRRLLAPSRRQRQVTAEGWYFTGDTGFFDGEGDLFVTGRVDDMIITGGENVSPVEIESCLSLHPAVSKSRWSACRTSAGARSSSPSSNAASGRAGGARCVCRTSGLANFKRPRALRLRRRDPEIAGRQTAAPQARGRRIRRSTLPRKTTQQGTAA